MARTTRSRLSEVRVRTATADDTKHGRQLFDGLGSNGLYLHVTRAGAKCWVQQLMVRNAATGKSRRVRIGLGAWPRVTLAQARKAAFANRCLRDEGRDPLAAKRHRAHEAAKEARGATWSEIDRDARTWTITARRMKAKRSHRVPFSGRAMAILDEAPARQAGDDAVERRPPVAVPDQARRPSAAAPGDGAGVLGGGAGRVRRDRLSGSAGEHPPLLQSFAPRQARADRDDGTRGPGIPWLRGVRRLGLGAATGGRRRLPRGRHPGGSGPGGHDACAVSRSGDDHAFVVALRLATAGAGAGGGGVGSARLGDP